MANLTGDAFEDKFNDSSTGLFKTNTTKAINSERVRTLVTDTKDSFLNRTDDVLDEDDMASNSATAVPTQQSVKAYVDAAALGIVTSWKAPVAVATTANITLSGEQTIDGVLTSASRILVKDQSTASQNGIYVTAAGAWARASDANAAAELEGAAVMVQQGTLGANTTWVQTTDGITLGSSNIVWVNIGTTVPAATASVAGIGKLYTSTGSNTDGSMTQNAITSAIIGVQDLFIPASAMRPTITAGCAALANTEMAAGEANVQTLDFDQTTEEHAQFQIVLPRKYNNSTVTFKAWWTASAGSAAQTVRWQMNARAFSDDDALTAALGSSIAVDDALIATNDLHISAESSAVTIAGTPASEDLIVFQVHRGVSADNLAADAKLIGLSLRITTTAAKDA